MFKRNALLALLLLCVGAWSAHCQSPSLKTEIKLTQTLVRNNETFFVTTVIRNSGATEKTLVVWTCSYPAQWISDNPLVDVIQANCLQNVRVKIKLKPGESFERAVPVKVRFAAVHSQSQLVTFRLGFGAAAWYAYQKTWPKVPPIWSNPVTLMVKAQPTTLHQ